MKRQILLASTCAALLAATPALAVAAINGNTFNHEAHDLSLVLHTDEHSPAFDRAPNALTRPITDITVNRYETQLHHDLSTHLAFLQAEPSGF